MLVRTRSKGLVEAADGSTTSVEAADGSTTGTWATVGPAEVLQVTQQILTEMALEL